MPGSHTEVRFWTQHDPLCNNLLQEWGTLHCDWNLWLIFKDRTTFWTNLRYRGKKVEIRLYPLWWYTYSLSTGNCLHTVSILDWSKLVFIPGHGTFFCKDDVLLPRGPSNHTASKHCFKTKHTVLKKLPSWVLLQFPKGSTEMFFDQLTNMLCAPCTRWTSVHLITGITRPLHLKSS